MVRGGIAPRIRNLHCIEVSGQLGVRAALFRRNMSPELID